MFEIGPNVIAAGFGALNCSLEMFMIEGIKFHFLGLVKMIRNLSPSGRFKKNFECFIWSSFLPVLTS